MLLEVSGVQYAYSGALAVRDVSLELQEGEIVALLGSNGAGKTTTVKMLAGVLRPAAGTIRFDGEDITGWAAHHVVERGITLVPEGRLVFPQLTVQENLFIGSHSARARGQRTPNLDRVFGIFPRLLERQDQPAGSLSGGEQQMLAIARGLMSAPKLMILDEPSLGLSPILVLNLFKLIRTLNQTGISILLVEQNVFQSLQIANRAYVLEKGNIVLSDQGAALLENKYVKEAFLGL
jgi:branched-chain amino acid transport system ATP-binding protein